MTKPRAGVRPTTRKVAEALFQILEHGFGSFEGRRVLDVCAGTGQFGLGALERGACEAVFVEASPAVAADLRARARRPGGRVIQGSAPAALSRVSGRFDVVFMDPPYGTDVAARSLPILDGLVAADGVVVVEHHHKDPLPERAGTLARQRVQRYGETALTFYAHPKGDEQP